MLLIAEKSARKIHGAFVKGVCWKQWDMFPSDNHFYDLLVQDSAALTVGFH